VLFVEHDLDLVFELADAVTVCTWAGAAVRLPERIGQR